MASMQLQDIREMGEAMTRARELCLEAQYEKGLALYQTTLRTLSQFIRRMTKMSERQPWLQMQIELENELSLITDYVELTQAFKAPPGAAVARIHPQVPRQEVAASPRWEICAPPDPRRPDPSVEDSNDPDVWAPPSPEKAPNRFRGGGAARAAPSWANDNNSNNNNPRNKYAAYCSVLSNSELTILLICLICEVVLLGNQRAAQQELEEQYLLGDVPLEMTSDGKHLVEVDPNLQRAHPRLGKARMAD
ncbi:hypothetical protein PRIC1_002530 [Phytophthora ramorum]